MERIYVRPSLPLDAVVRPPGSKSLSNRAVLLAALARGRSVLSGMLDSEDTRIMLEALRLLGVQWNFDVKNRTVSLCGCGGDFPEKNAEIYAGNSGTTARFLCAALALSPGENQYRIHGNPRMHQRPVSDLVNALKLLGANLRCEHSNGCPPVQIGFSPHAQSDWNTPGSQGRPIVATVSGEKSSQFLSALMMSAPLISRENDVVLKIRKPLVSRPYVEMTAKIMESFGVEPFLFFPNRDDEIPSDTGNFQDENEPQTIAGTITVPKGSQYEGREYSIEPDASAASYFFAAAAICGGRITVEGLSEKSLQGDVGFVKCLREMGCKVQSTDRCITVSRDPGTMLRGITVDMNAISDTVPTLAVLALFAEGLTRITNIAHIREKETDRIAAVATELRKIGAVVEEFADAMEIHPPSERKTAEIATYDDHRIAMSFSLCGLGGPEIAIQEPRCVEKTYPDFFRDLGSITRPLR